jgi:hypothetical protein
VLLDAKFRNVYQDTILAVAVVKLELETYTPSEAEIITGVSQATVRNWRRAKHLPRHEGHARYHIGELLVMFSMGMIVSRGTAVETAKSFAGETARAVFHSLIYSKNAFSDEANEAALAEVGDMPEDRINALASVGVDASPELVADILALEFRVKAAEQAFGISGTKRPDWLVIWADDSIEFFYSGSADEDFFGNIAHDGPYVQGPVILLCLGALAQLVLDRLPRPPIRLAKEAAS